MKLVAYLCPFLSVGVHAAPAPDTIYAPASVAGAAIELDWSQARPRVSKGQSDVPDQSMQAIQNLIAQLPSQFSFDKEARGQEGEAYWRYEKVRGLMLSKNFASIELTNPKLGAVHILLDYTSESGGSAVVVVERLDSSRGRAILVTSEYEKLRFNLLKDKRSPLVKEKVKAFLPPFELKVKALLAAMSHEKGTVPTPVEPPRPSEPSGNVVYATALSQAVTSGREESVIRLLAQGADVNEKCLYTPLLAAIDSGSDEMLELVLSAGANPNVPNAAGYMPIFVAARKGNEFAIRRLVESGALYNERDPKGRWLENYRNITSDTKEFLKTRVPVNLVTPRVHALYRACRMGSRAAQYELGMLYGDDNSSEVASVDYAESNHWLRKAALKGEPKAQFELALRYLFGMGYDVDAKKAAHWLRMAERSGHPEAKEFLRSLKRKR